MGVTGAYGVGWGEAAKPETAGVKRPERGGRLRGMATNATDDDAAHAPAREARGGAASEVASAAAAEDTPDAEVVVAAAAATGGGGGAPGATAAVTGGGGGAPGVTPADERRLVLYTSLLMPWASAHVTLQGRNKPTTLVRYAVAESLKQRSKDADNVALLQEAAAKFAALLTR